MIMLRRIVLALVLIVCVLAVARATSAQSERPGDAQSTTGPTPPPGIDLQGLRASARAASVVLDVPAYFWYGGCGPTAAAMLIGYWDARFPDLIPGDAQRQTAAVNAVIASAGYFLDYAQPYDSPPVLLPDHSSTGLPAHGDDSLADFMWTSRSAAGNYYGWSWFYDASNALASYVGRAAPPGWAVQAVTMGNELTWDAYRAEIDRNRPVLFLVDTDADGITDHFVAAVGYDSAGDYALLNTWDRFVHWYPFAALRVGQPWGIYGGVTLAPPIVVMPTRLYFLPFIGRAP